jgi:hypothetical protein
MKKSLIVASILSLSLLSSCGSPSGANAPEGYLPISETKLPGAGYLREYRHIETGCHFTIVSGDGKGIVEMRDADDKPYCD